MVEESDEQKTYWDLKREQVENADAAKSEGSALSSVGEPRNVTPVVASIAVVAVAAIVNLALGRAALEQREQVVNEQGEKKHIKEQEKLKAKAAAAEVSEYTVTRTERRNNHSPHTLLNVVNAKSQSSPRKTSQSQSQR